MFTSKTTGLRNKNNISRILRMLDQDVKTEFTSDDEKQPTVIATDVTGDIDRDVEKKLLRKFDLRILPLLTFMYLCS